MICSSRTEESHFCFRVPSLVPVSEWRSQVDWMHKNHIQYEERIQCGHFLLLIQGYVCNYSFKVNQQSRTLAPASEVWKALPHGGRRRRMGRTVGLLQRFGAADEGY